jgi:DnaJ-class molecular chaperone
MSDTNVQGIPGFIVCESYIIRTCPSCNGDGKTLVLPNDNQPPHRDPCHQCNETGLIRIYMDDIPRMRIAQLK